MSKVEILAELPRLSSEDRREIAEAIFELENDHPFSFEEIAFLQMRLDVCADNLTAFAPWEETEKRLRARLIR